MGKPKNAAMNNVIQFRSGEWTGRKLEGLAVAWGLTRHEAARRLMVLAMYRLSLDHYPAIGRLEQAVGGGQSFLRACDQAGAALDACAASRRENLQSPMTEWERAEFLEEWSTRFTDPPIGLPGELKPATAGEGSGSGSPWPACSSRIRPS